ncbi:MAG: NAD(+) synthase [Eggerthellaceae bacterium]|nr:NAD(+) synthase [Eggerthellaceae bacterium]
MKDGFITVAAATPRITVADCKYNAQAIIESAASMANAGAKIIALPELCITAYTCNDLFWQTTLLDEAEEALCRIAQETSVLDALILVGMPLRVSGKLLNVAAVISRGEILGFVPKKNLPAYNEFYETRHFAPGSENMGTITFNGSEVPIGTNLLFTCSTMPDVVVAAEICEDLWVPNPPSTSHALAGATIICNLSASDEMVGKRTYRDSLVSGQSARLVSAYIYATAGEGESTTDLVFGGQNIIAENGVILAETPDLQGTTENESTGILTTIDVARLAAERRRMSTYPASDSSSYRTISFELAVEETTIARHFDADPFVPTNPALLDHRCEEILSIQALGLKKRLAHTHANTAVVGISGGLDSTLALLVTARAFDMLGLDRANIIAVTMPGFGTTDRTYTNACSMVKSLGATLREVSISEAVLQHFADIGHDPSVHDVTYENSQARERTQILMDIANQENGLVIGTGDLSELALGWATYNGDHMSMYAVNASVPKTLVRHLVRYYASTCEDNKLSQVLTDVLNTPVSPELLPPTDGAISQKTEDLVGPYELHDFFLYQMLRFGFTPSKIYRIALLAFKERYDADTIKKWLRTFYRRFFAQQFKRSCLPDGPKVGSIAVSPRGDLRMPSDACATAWLEEVDSL